MLTSFEMLGNVRGQKSKNRHTDAFFLILCFLENRLFVLKKQFFRGTMAPMILIKICKNVDEIIPYDLV